MISEMIDAVKKSEKDADLKQKKAKKEAEIIVKKANEEAENIVEAKIKEANAKAELRINFAKNSASENISKSLKECENDIKRIKEISHKNEDQIVKTVIETVIGESIG